MKEIAGKLMLGVAFLTCPCHLPIYAALLAGTALGSYFSENLPLAFGLLTAIFAFSIITGLKMARPEKKEMRKLAEGERYTREF